MGGVGTWMRRVDRGGMLLFLDESLGGGFSSLEAGQGDIHMNLGNIRLIRAAPDNRQESHVRHDNQRCDQVESSGFFDAFPGERETVQVIHRRHLQRCRKSFLLLRIIHKILIYNNFI